MTAQQVEGEEWRAIPGFAGYEVSNLGRVRSYRAHGGNRGGRMVAEPRMKTTRRHGNGYLFVVLQADLGKARPQAVHTLVASAFLGPRPEGFQVAHADGDKMNARLDNLRYATPRENAQDKQRHGTTCRGESDGNSKLTASQVRQIIAHCQAGQRQKDVAQLFGISQSQVSNIVRGASWSHLNLGRAA